MKNQSNILLDVWCILYITGFENIGELFWVIYSVIWPIPYIGVLEALEVGRFLKVVRILVAPHSRYRQVSNIRCTLVGN